MSVCLIGLGSNQGNRQAILDAAVARLAAHPQIKLLATSAWRDTAPIGGPPKQSRFLNGAIRLETSLAPQDLLGLMQQVEGELGRERAERWGSRTIDLDLLLCDELTLDAPSLTIPHPRMAWRRFVLEPAAEVGGAMLHPTIRWTVAQLLEHLNVARPYVAVTGPIGAGKTRLVERLAAAVPAQAIVEQPDWPRLDAFYADPPSHAWQMEQKFLCQRVALLDAEAAEWSEPRWKVSDFWFDQSAAFARTWLPDDQLPAFLEQYEQLRQRVAPPKLIVLLDAPAEKLLARVRRRGRTCEQRLTLEQMDRLRRTVREQAETPGLGPVLSLSGDSAEANLAEVLAAVRGME